MKRSMSFSAGFLGPKGDDGCMHTYDHTKAVAAVEAEIARNPSLVEAQAGLDGDWDVNHDTLWTKSEGFMEPSFYQHSYWAIPSLLFIYEDGEERDGGPCYTDYTRDGKLVGEAA